MTLLELINVKITCWLHVENVSELIVHLFRPQWCFALLLGSNNSQTTPQEIPLVKEGSFVVMVRGLGFPMSLICCQDKVPKAYGCLFPVLLHSISVPSEVLGEVCVLEGGRSG